MFSLLRVLIIFGLIFLALYALQKIIVRHLAKKRNAKEQLAQVDEKIDEAIDSIKEAEAAIKDEKKEAEEVIRNAEEFLEKSKTLEEELDNKKTTINKS